MDCKQFPLCLAGLLAVAACTTPEAQILASGSLGPVDADYVNTTYTIVQLDVQEGKLAATRAADPRVRDLSSQVVAQAGVLYPQLQGALRAEGVKPPAGTPLDVAAEVQKLSGLSGSAFDKQYVADQIASHQRALAVFQKEDKLTKADALRAEVETALPVVQDNLAKLQYISGDISGNQG